MFVLAATVLLALTAAVQAASQTPAPQTASQQTATDADAIQESTKKRAIESDPQSEIRHALFRLPLAAALGAALAFRPRRRGTPPRQPPVIQTQIILAMVGALVMLVVGTNLARAFGVVGAAGLVRYRARIEDPKDAGVMLSTLAVGLSCGVGLYILAALSAGVILIALWVIESFEPKTLRSFELVLKMGPKTDTLRDQIDAILHRYHVDFELRSTSDEVLCYDVAVPLEMSRERVTTALLRLDPGGHGSVEWTEKKAKPK